MNIKKRVSNFVYNKIQQYYFKLTKARNKMSTQLHTLETYEVSVIEKFKNTNFSIFNFIETVYFALTEVYGNKSFSSLRIQGVSLDFSNDEKLIVNIQANRPGLLIGYHGKDIDRLTAVLTNYFNYPVEVKIKEVKDLTHIVYRNY